MIISVDPTACTGYGLCHELLPEVIALDEWGYPVLTNVKPPRTTAEVPAGVEQHAKTAAANCPRLALRVKT